MVIFQLAYFNQLKHHILGISRVDASSRRTLGQEAKGAFDLMDLVRANWDGVQNSITLTQSTKKDSGRCGWCWCFSFYCSFSSRHMMCFIFLMFIFKACLRFIVFSSRNMMCVCFFKQCFRFIVFYCSRNMTYMMVFSSKTKGANVETFFLITNFQQSLVMLTSDL